MNIPFDDYLELSSRRLINKRAIIFIGCSGAGKSSYIEFLLTQHPDYREQEVFRIKDGRPLTWNEIIPARPSLIIIDELLVLRDLWRVFRLMQKGHRVLVASHLPGFWHWPLRLFGSMLQFRIDGMRSKVVNALNLRRVPFSNKAVDQFIRKYGANYTDLELILETCPGQDLDIALQRFDRFYSVERVRNK